MNKIQTWFYAVALLAAVTFFSASNALAGGQSLYEPRIFILAEQQQGVQGQGQQDELDEELLEGEFGEETPEEAEQAGDIISDPIIGFNRSMFGFNDKLYFWVLKPAARGWSVIPEKGRIGVRNFFDNLGWPVRFFNCLFQAKFKGAGSEISRFFVNTTVGIVGVFDPAKKWLHLETYEEDFGQTLGVWGMGNWFYLNIPFVGPLTVRDGIGTIPDMALNPVTFIPGAGIVQTINTTSLKIGEYEDFKESSLDPYIAIRNAYVQHRQSKVEK
ncbi:MAG TPA: VacJ family lipoprotein [Thermodesulfovibrionia bacterium]|nr:VacJ family lipoprotein [Thermodesulfovibrionia bacterium]